MAGGGACPASYTGLVPQAWDPALYQSSHSFVWQFGRDLLALLDAKPGERILDAGCGTGQLTAEIARAGAIVTGIDNSPDMIAKARGNFPDLTFEVHDVCHLPYRGEFDAVFSNAVLHWVTHADDAAASIESVLNPGGRFVAELGGHGNIRALLDASDRALLKLGVSDPGRFHPWFYPSIAEYAAILERHGLEVTFAVLFDRMTPLDGGDEAIPNWLRMFGSRLVEALPPDRVRDYHRLTREFAAPALLGAEGWAADYRRLRVVAHRRA